MLLDLATRLRELADRVWTESGTEFDERRRYRARHRMLRGISGELHRLARLIEEWVERGEG